MLVGTGVQTCRINLCVSCTAFCNGRTSTIRHHQKTRKKTNTKTNKIRRGTRETKGRRETKAKFHTGLPHMNHMWFTKRWNTGTHIWHGNASSCGMLVGTGVQTCRINLCVSCNTFCNGRTSKIRHHQVRRRTAKNTQRKTRFEEEQEKQKEEKKQKQSFTQVCPT